VVLAVTNDKMLEYSKFQEHDNCRD
jgi:hypothetical protein